MSTTVMTLIVTGIGMAAQVLMVGIIWELRKQRHAAEELNEILRRGGKL